MSFISDLEKITPAASEAPAPDPANVSVQDLKDLQKAFDERIEAMQKDLQAKMDEFFKKENIAPVGSIENNNTKESEVDENGSSADL